MKQSLEIIVTTNVDLDLMSLRGWGQPTYEGRLKDRIEKAILEAIGTPVRDTEVVELAYGDPL